MKTRKRVLKSYAKAIGIIPCLPGKTMILVILFTFICPCIIIAQEWNEAIYHVRQPSKLHKFFLLISENKFFSESELLNLVKDTDPGARQFAILQLAEIIAPGEAVVAAVCEGLGDPDENVRFQALAGLINIGKPATKFLAQEISTDRKAEKDNLPKVSYSTYSYSERKPDLAFCALQHIQEIDIEALVNIYESSTLQGKERILYLLKKAAGEPTPALREALYGDDMGLAIAVAGVVGRAGEKAINAIPGLNYLVLNGSPDAQRAALAALGNIPGMGHLRLRDIIAHGNMESRRLAIEAFPYHADSAVAILTGVLHDPDKKIRLTALSRFNNNNYRQSNFYSIPDSLFLATLPTKTRQDLVLLLKDEDPEIRKAAVSAVGSIGLSDVEFGFSITDTLLKMIVDTDWEVRSIAISQLNLLAEEGITPKSVQAVSWMINNLVEAIEYGNFQRPTGLLKQMKIIAPLDLNLIERMINCGLKMGSHTEMATLLKSNPVWANEAIRSLTRMYPDFSVINSVAFSMLQVLGYSEITSIDNLDRLLKHPAFSLRLTAAIGLSEKGLYSNEIIDVLEDGVHSSIILPELSSKALFILANYYPGGVDHLIAIMKDSKTNIKTRGALLGTCIREMAGRNAQAAALLLHYAAEFSYPDLQVTAIKSLPSLYLPVPQLETVLINAFSSPDEDVREAVVDVWKKSNLPAGSIIHQVANDISPNIRAAGIKLIDHLPKGDLRQITLLNAALLDNNGMVVDTALSFAGRMGNEGQIILENYVKTGKTLNDNFFEAIRRLFPIRQSLITALESRISKVSPSIRARIYEILLENDSTYFIDKRALYHLLHHPDRNERYFAAQTLLNIPDNSLKGDPLVVAVLMEYYTHTTAKYYSCNFYNYSLTARSAGTYPASVSSGIQSLDNYTEFSVTSTPAYNYDVTPRARDISFPWPPPPGCKQTVVPLSYFPTGSTSTFAGIHNAITKALLKCNAGYEHGFFQLKDGFALVARMERIKPDGTPFPDESRWATKGVPNLKLLDFLGDLFFQKPGYFRIIAFAVTSELSPPAEPTSMSTSTRSLPQVDAGLPDIPDEFADRGRTNQKIIALVYTYERKPRAEIAPWEGTPSALQHLEKSGILNNLNK